MAAEDRGRGFQIGHIGVVTGSYPTADYPSRGRFVRELVKAWSGIGLKVTVVHPCKLHQSFFTRAGRPQVLRPRFLSLASAGLGPLRCSNLTLKSFRAAAWRGLCNSEQPIDAMYGHFLYPGGAAAVAAGKRLGIPSFIAVGESSPWTLEAFANRRIEKDFEGVTGIVSVSAINRRWIETDLALPVKNVAVFPNGVDLKVFKPFDRSEARRSVGIPEGLFIVAFVGEFNHRKGADRVVAAVGDIEGLGIVMLGSGALKERPDNLLVCGSVPHESLPLYLASADVFVLPTLREGSCNALVEAMACGLPIVSSLGDFNDDILVDEIALRVDPLNLEEIRGAILALRDNPVRRRHMAAAALARAQMFDLKTRAKNIHDWMCEVSAAETGGMC